jgi:hypothetical protein
MLGVLSRAIIAEMALLTPSQFTASMPYPFRQLKATGSKGYAEPPLALNSTF